MIKKTIYEKFLEVEKEIVNDFLQEVYKVINNKLGNEFDIEFTPVTKKYERNLKIKKIIGGFIFLLKLFWTGRYIIYTTA